MVRISHINIARQKKHPDAPSRHAVERDHRKNPHSNWAETMEGHMKSAPNFKKRKVRLSTIVTTGGAEEYAATTHTIPSSQQTIRKNIGISTGNK